MCSTHGHTRSRFPVPRCRPLLPRFPALGRGPVSPTGHGREASVAAGPRRVCGELTETPCTGNGRQGQSRGWGVRGRNSEGRPGHRVRARPRQPGLRRFSSQRLSPRPDAGREPHTAGGRPCAPCDPESPGPAGRAASGGARPSAALRPGRELALRLRPPCSLRRRHTCSSL